LEGRGSGVGEWVKSSRVWKNRSRGGHSSRYHRQFITLTGMRISLKHIREKEGILSAEKRSLKDEENRK
jgi:hypothetical protein